MENISHVTEPFSPLWSSIEKEDDKVREHKPSPGVASGGEGFRKRSGRIVFPRGLVPVEAFRVEVG
jgi:hypothetical protein